MVRLKIKKKIYVFEPVRQLGFYPTANNTLTMYSKWLIRPYSSEGN